MNERLREINRSLHALDEAHRLGRISREEYRTRRRHLLGPLCDGGGITARNSVDAATVPHARAGAASVRRSDRDDSMSAMFPWWTRLFGWLGRLFGRR